MIHHILLFKFLDNAKHEDITKVMEKLTNCKGKIDGLAAIQVGENISIKKHLSGGYTYGVIMEFTNAEAIITYGKSSFHNELQELEKPCVKEILVFDIEG